MKYPTSYLYELTDKAILKPFVEKHNLFFDTASVVEPIKNGPTKNKLNSAVLAVYCLGKLKGNRSIRLTFDSEKCIGIKSEKPFNIDMDELNHDWQILLQSIDHTHTL